MKPHISVHWGQWMIGFEIDYLYLIAIYIGPIQIVW